MTSALAAVSAPIFSSTGVPAETANSAAKSTPRKVYPDDKRPREAIEAAKEWLKNPSSAAESAAESAASAAESAAESAAIRTKCNDFVLKRIKLKE